MTSAGEIIIISLGLLLRKKRGVGMSEPMEKSEEFALSNSQMNIWRLENAFPDTPQNNICCALEVTGQVDLAMLKKAAESVLRRVPALRTRIHIKDGEPRQYLVPDFEPQLSEYDFSKSSFGAKTWLQAVASTPMRVTDGALYSCAVYRVSPRAGGVMLCMHHLISDAWGQGLLLQAMVEAYLRLLRGEALSEEAFPDYEAHVMDEKAYLASEKHQADADFFQGKLSAHQPSGEKCPCFSPAGERASFRLPRMLARLSDVFCAKNRVSPFLLFLSALLIYEKRVQGEEKPCIGVPVLGRRTMQDKKTPGMFVQTLPMSSDVPLDMPFSRFIETLNEQWYELLRHERLPFSDIEQMTGGTPLFDTVLSFQAGVTTAAGDMNASFNGRWYYSGCQTEKLCLHLSSDGEQLTLDVDYLTQLYEKAEAEKFARSLFTILTAALEAPETPLGALRLMDAQEVDGTLTLSGGQAAEGSVRELLLQTALRYPRRVAVIDRGERTTYETLLKEAEELSKAFSAGDVLSIEEKRGKALLAAMCAALLAGVPFMLPDVHQPAARLQKIRESAGITIIFADGAMKRLRPAEAVKNKQPAYFVATSGSTGEPKLVAVGEKALFNFAVQMAPFYGRSAVLSLCNAAFDAFLIESAAALLNVRTIVIASEEEMNDPDALAALMRSYDAGFLSMTPSRMTAYLESERFQKALYHAESLVFGGERFPQALLNRLKALTNARIYNQYGPTEAAVCVSAKMLNDADEITCGTALAGCRIYVLDDALRPVPTGTVGEICIAGACLSLGYWGDTKRTDAAFVSAPFEERLYKTGDLGRISKRGELICLGRRDGQIKLNGRRVETGEIEAALKAQELVRDACVVMGENGLVAYIAAQGKIDETHLRARLLNLLPAYMAPKHFMFLSALPMTPNGKVDRNALPQPENGAGEQASNDAEQAVLTIFRETLHHDTLGVTDDYFKAGGDSLSALKTLARLRETLGMDLPVAALHEYKTARELAALLRKSEKAPEKSPNQSELNALEQDEYSLSPAQESFYALMLMDGGVTYNMPGAFKVQGRLDAVKLEKAFNDLLALDEQLRVSFVRRDGQVLAKYGNQVHFSLEQVEGNTWEDAFRAFVRPFDLSVSPLLRAALYEDKDGEQTLFADMPHVVSDGISGALLARRLDALYRGETISMPALRYRDYALQSAKRAADDRTLAFWRGQLENYQRAPEFPLDYHAEGVSVCGVCKSMLSKDISDKTEALARSLEVTPYAVLCAAFLLVSARIRGTDSLCIGTPMVGRSGEWLDVSGPFVRTLPLMLKTESTFADTVRGVFTAALGALDHMDIRPAELMRLSGQRSGEALYDTLFSFLPASPEHFEVGGVHLERRSFVYGAVKALLSLETVREDEGYRLELSFDAARLAHTTAEFVMRAVTALLENGLSAPEQTLTMRSMLPVADRVRLFDRPRRRSTPIDRATLFERIEEAALLMPGRVAVVNNRGTLTYQALIHKARSFGAYLIEKGVQSGESVGVLLHRGLDLLPALLGIWAAGCAYLPLDISFPPSRMRLMLETTNTRFAVTDEAGLLPEGTGAEELLLSFDTPEMLLPPPEADAPAYILFTSGSTGAPKGVVIPHAALSNLAAEAEGLLADCGTVLCATSDVFDVFVTETWLPLILGRTVVMADDQQMLMPIRLAGVIDAFKVDLIQMTPSRMRLGLTSHAFRGSLRNVRRILLIGEELTLSLKNAIQAETKARIINQYGPTEATVLCSWVDVTSESRRITIGRPAANCRFYALNAQGEQVLPLAEGELYIAGQCLALGYAGREDLTNAAFVPDPFKTGEKMYRTGDLVRLLPNGEWAFAGRRDGQIKLDGHRIELSELESAALESGCAQEAAAAAVRRDGEIQALRLFVVPSEHYDQTLLMAEMRKRLPAYMLPARIDTLSEIPRLASGKTDRRTLENLPFEKMKPAAVQGGTDDWMSALWRRTLRLSAIGDDDDFFALGGTSLTALMVLSEYIEKGKRMTPDEFYRSPTLRAQRVLLSGGTTAKQSAGKAPEGNGATLPRFAPEKRLMHSPRGDILLTGASGFLGAHVLKEMLTAGSFIVCLTRDEERLKSAIHAYFGDRLMGFKIVKGDVTKPRFGLPFREYADLALRTGLVIHCAADVRHYAVSDAIQNTNVQGTRHVIDFCLDAEATLCHVSTISIAGTHAPKPFCLTERDVFAGQNALDNAYLASKLYAETAVLSAMEKQGLDAQILRVGRLCGRAEDGQFQLNAGTNMFCRLLRGLHEVGFVPESRLGEKFELTPVDACARAIRTLLKEDGAVYHVASPKSYSLGELANAMGILSVSDSTFTQRLREKMLASSSPYLPTLAVFSSAGTEQNVTTDMEMTLDTLRAAGFIWPEPPLDRLIGGMKEE